MTRASRNFAITDSFIINQQCLNIMMGAHVTEVMPIVQCGQDRSAQLSVVQVLILFRV